jgi:hypothetical protein
LSSDPVVDASVGITIGCSGESSPPHAGRAKAATSAAVKAVISLRCLIAGAR